MRVLGCIVLLVAALAVVQGQYGGSAAISSAAGAVKTVDDMVQAVRSGIATGVDGSRTASDVGRTAIEVIADILQVPQDPPANRSPAQVPRRRGGMLQSLFGNR